ncbi:hypothetical protein BDZ91DRAFT_660943 [Kalaharituber pfeilii]|nr:hypothetical protein BDZ91DRAFT_660943 [Kalaharituber pfeilii]
MQPETQQQPEQGQNEDQERSQFQQPESGSNPQANLAFQRQLLAKRLAEKAANPVASPTDSMMSPCSRMLAQHKNRQFSKAKPKLLTKAFSQVAAATEKDKENQKRPSLFGVAAEKKKTIPTDEPIF